MDVDVGYNSDDKSTNIKKKQNNVLRRISYPQNHGKKRKLNTNGKPNTKKRKLNPKNPSLWNINELKEYLDENNIKYNSKNDKKYYFGLVKKNMMNKNGKTLESDDDNDNNTFENEIIIKKKRRNTMIPNLNRKNIDDDEESEYEDEEKMTENEDNILETITESKEPPLPANIDKRSLDDDGSDDSKRKNDKKERRKKKSNNNNNNKRRWSHNPHAKRSLLLNTNEQILTNNNNQNNFEAIIIDTNLNNNNKWNEFKECITKIFSQMSKYYIWIAILLVIMATVYAVLFVNNETDNLSINYINNELPTKMLYILLGITVFCLFVTWLYSYYNTCNAQAIKLKKALIKEMKSKPNNFYHINTLRSQILFNMKHSRITWNILLREVNNSSEIMEYKRIINGQKTPVWMIKKSG